MAIVSPVPQDPTQEMCVAKLATTSSGISTTAVLAEPRWGPSQHPGAAKHFDSGGFLSSLPFLSPVHG
eukprot:4029741-Amphidinium_carterae.1